MPSSTSVAQAFQLYMSGNVRAAVIAFREMAREEQEHGRHTGAQRLIQIARQMEERLNAQQGEAQNGVPEEIQGLLMKDEHPKDLEKIYLYPEVRGAVDSFIEEYKNSSQLSAAGLGIRNRIIMAGPPGNGKTVLASAIAKQLGLEMYKCDFSQIISAYMGIGPRNLGNIFRFVKNSEEPVCLFMDEADAIVTSREMLSGQAAGACAQEYRVMVNTILTGMDELSDKGLIIAASNFERNLDAAAMRRFNLKLWLKPPAVDGIIKYVNDYETTHNINFNMDNYNNLDGLPWSKIEEFCLEQHRSIVLGRPCSLATGWIGR
jgi:SpoVK/Ycf46/Vps4 family AAA+-type ATPase